jgi:hypothetical protein
LFKYIRRIPRHIFYYIISYIRNTASPHFSLYPTSLFLFTTSGSNISTIKLYIKAQAAMHRTTARMPPTPRLAIFAAPPVKVAAPGLTDDALAATDLLGGVDATGMTLIVWYTTAKLLELEAFETPAVEYVIGEKLRFVDGALDMAGFETIFAGEPGAADIGTTTGVVAADTGQIVVYRTLVSVVKDPIFAGQFVTVAGQAVIV